MAHHPTQCPLPAPIGDRSPLTRLFSEQAALHLEWCTTRPTPDLLRRMARVEAAIAAGGA
jgi:hypothetical protein